MEIEPIGVTVRELVAGYSDKGDNVDEEVRGYAGNLDIRPAFQRSFVYDDKERDAVIRTVLSNYPLNVMYWGLRDDGKFEVIDGQQRTISIARFYDGRFSVDGRLFHTMQDDEQKAFLDYELQVYRCKGTASEKLEWFKIVNIKGLELKPQELRNAVYAGPWLTDAKRYFSRRGGAPDANDYLTGSAVRQEHLETVIKWIKDDGLTIEEYMAKHQLDETAEELWNHYRSIIERIQELFPTHRKIMKGIAWGELYGQLQKESRSPDELEEEVARLVLDDDVTKKSGIYPFLLSGEERYLNIRTFTDAMKLTAYERQGKKCKGCNKPFRIEEMEADHIDPWSEGGKTVPENCQMLCRPCNRRKGAK